MKNFKDSGIEWLGEIPGRWEVVKIKFLTIFYTGDSIKDSEKHKYCFSNNSIPYIATKDIDINTNTINYNNGMFIEKNNANFKRAYENSILLCLEGANAGKKIAFLNKEVCFINKLCYINSISEKLISKFLFYFFQSVFFKNTFLSNIKGLIGGVTTEQLGNFYMLLPSLKEQEQIVNFLDEKCEKIKNFIEKKEKLISLLKEQKQALINETITKGLDKNVNFKDSSIEWLGEIPEHWKIVKLKHIASLRNQKSNNIDFRIGLENIESKTGKFIPSGEVVFEEDGIGFKKGDILFGKLRPYLAKVFLTDRDGICVSEFLVLKIKSESNKFIKFLMLSSLFIDIVDSSTYGTKMPRANWKFIGNLKIPLPPLKEQEQIAKFLDEKCEKIDLLIEKTKKQIKLIKEYKTTLINQAVCGRISL